MAVQRQKSIEEQGGIEIKLDNEAALHNGFAYHHFDLFCRLKLPNTIIARLLNVRTVDTIKHWKEHRLKLLAEEKENRKRLQEL